MEVKNSVVIPVFALAFLGLAVIAVLQYAEIRSMRNVLIDQTVARLDRQYEQAQIAETENLAALNGRLNTVLANLAALNGLTEQERRWIEEGIALAKEIRGVAAGMRLTYE